MFPITLDLSFLGWDELRGYEGFYFFLAFLTAILIFRPRVFKMGVTQEQLNTFILILIPSAMIGAKYFDLFVWNWDPMMNEWAFVSQQKGGDASFFWFLVSKMNPTSGGNTVTGGMIMGVFGAWIFCRWKGIHIGTFFDKGAPAIMFGDTVGRMGCFMNGDSHGGVTDLPWGFPVPETGGYTFCIPGGFRELPPGNLHGQGYKVCSDVSDTAVAADATSPGHLVIDPIYWGKSVHPTQIYEMLGVLAIGLITIFLIERRGWLKNRLVWFVAFCYGILRFGMETMRHEFLPDSRVKDVASFDPTTLGLTPSQWLTVAMILIGLVGMIFFKGITQEEFTKRWQARKKAKGGGTKQQPQQRKRAKARA